MKKLLAALLALSMLAACGGSSDDDDGASSDDGGGGGNAGKAPAATTGFDGTTITLGVITPQTGVAALIGKPLTNGNDVFFKRLNDAGGIAGKYKVRLEIVDSQYQPQTAVQQYNATKGKVAAYVQILGTGVLKAVLPLLKTDNIVASPATLDSFWIPEQQLLALGAPYQVQAINAMDWWINEEGNEDSTVCLMRQDDPYGEAGKEGLEIAAEEFGFEIAEEVTFAATDTDWSAQVNQLKAADCEVVQLVGLPNSTGGIMGAAEQIGFAPQWIGQAPTWLGAFKGNTYMQEHFALVTEGPEWGDQSVPGMKQLLEDTAKYAPDQAPDIYYLFGYVQAWSMAQVLERAVQLGDLSRKGIVEAMNSVGTLKTGGLFPDYDYGPPEDRKFPRAGRIFRVDAAEASGLKAVTDLIASEAAEKFEVET